MAKIQLPPLQNDAELDRALARIWELFDSEPGTPERDELRALADIVEAYEDIHYPIPLPTPLGALEFWVDQWHLTLDDLAPVIGSKEQAAAILNGQQEITPEIANALHQKLDIDLRDLLPQPAATHS